MESLKNKIVLITGASSGIGLACAAKFAEQGAKLIVAARRRNRLEELAKDLKKKYQTNSLVLELDVRNNAKVEKVIHSLPSEWKDINVLVNNAGLSRGLDKVHEAKVDDWEEMIDTNIKGLLYVTRAVLPGMVKRNSGMVINIGSIAGFQPYPKGNVYSATKAAVDSLTDGLRMELVDTSIRVCSVDPGLVETEFSLVRYRGDAERAKPIYQGFQPLKPEDVADAVVFCATQPAHVQIAQLVVMPTNQASTTIVHRKS
ncbi:MAG: SDR family oxidoreductase [Ignavibacteriales bacterium]|nr:SDR family oxidoreductase [Ignavibacteriales bacterium]